MSFKMGAIGPTVGSVNSDQRAGLGGRLGPAPEMIPVTVDVQMPGTTDAPVFRTYRFSVVDDPLFTPTLVYWTIYNSLLAEGDDASRQTLAYRLETTWDGPADISDTPLVLEGIAAGPGGAAALASQWMAPISILINNRYEPVKLKSVRAKLEFTRPMAMASITAVDGPDVVAIEGQELVYKVQVKPRHKEIQTLEIPFVLPDGLTPGRYRIVAASEAELFALEAHRAAGRFQVADLSGIIDVLRSGRSDGTLVLALLGPGSGTIIKGKEHTGLPARVSRLLREGNSQATLTLADYLLRFKKKTPWVLQGNAIQDLLVISPNRPVKEERRP